MIPEKKRTDRPTQHASEVPQVVDPGNAQTNHKVQQHPRHESTAKNRAQRSWKPLATSKPEHHPSAHQPKYSPRGSDRKIGTARVRQDGSQDP